MTPMTFTEWRATEDTTMSADYLRQRYEAYLSGVAFIRSQIGGLPLGSQRFGAVTARRPAGSER